MGALPSIVVVDDSPARPFVKGMFQVSAHEAAEQRSAWRPARARLSWERFHGSMTMSAAKSTRRTRESRSAVTKNVRCAGHGHPARPGWQRSEACRCLFSRKECVPMTLSPQPAQSTLRARASRRALPGPRARRSRRRTRATIMVVVTTLVGMLVNVVTAGTARAATIGCQVTYVKQSEWPGGVTAQLTLQNSGTTAWNGWTMTFHFPDAGQKVGPNPWSANWSQSGTAVTATNLSWNANIAPGGNTQIGFNGTWTTADPVPTDFAINGVACTGPDTAPTVTVTAPTSGQHFTAPATINLAATATDPDSGDSISKVEFYHDGLLLATDTTAPYTFTWTGVPTGSYSIQAQAYDSRGASTLSPP